MQRSKNQVIEMEMTSLLQIRSTLKKKNACLLAPSTLDLGALEVPVPIMGNIPGIRDGSDEWTLFSLYGHSRLPMSMSQQAEKGTSILA